MISRPPPHYGIADIKHFKSNIYAFLWCNSLVLNFNCELICRDRFASPWLPFRWCLVLKHRKTISSNLQISDMHDNPFGDHHLKCQFWKVVAVLFKAFTRFFTHKYTKEGCHFTSFVWRSLPIKKFHAAVIFGQVSVTKNLYKETIVTCHHTPRELETFGG